MSCALAWSHHAVIGNASIVAKQNKTWSKETRCLQLLNKLRGDKAEQVGGGSRVSNPHLQKPMLVITHTLQIHSKLVFAGAEEISRPTMDEITLGLERALSPHNHAVNASSTNTKTNVTLLFEALGNLSLFGMICWMLNLKSRTAIDSINDFPPEG